MNFPNEPVMAGRVQRKQTYGVTVKNGKNTVLIGQGAPVVVQSMTNTDTSDVETTVRQVIELAKAGSELVRVTVNTTEAAKAVPLATGSIPWGAMCRWWGIFTITGICC